MFSMKLLCLYRHYEPILEASSAVHAVRKKSEKLYSHSKNSEQNSRHNKLLWLGVWPDSIDCLFQSHTGQ